MSHLPVIIALRTARHVPYLYTFILELVRQNHAIHIVGVQRKKSEETAIDLWRTALGKQSQMPVDLYVHYRRPERIFRKSVQETFEYHLAKSSGKLSKSELRRHIPMYKESKKPAHQVSLLSRIALVVIEKLLSFLPESFVIWLLKYVEGGQHQAREIIRTIRPCLVVASPCNMRSCHERVWIREANKHGVFSSIIVLSWDNPTTKGDFYVKPSVIFAQSELHRYAIQSTSSLGHRVEVVGSCQLERTLLIADELNREANWNDKKDPFVLYLGSSARSSANQDAYLKKVLEAVLLTGDTQLKLRVRPHPSNPVNSETRSHLVNSGCVQFEDPGHPGFADYQKFLHTLGSSLLVVGEATSALLESMAIGVPTYVLELEGARNYEERHIRALLQDSRVKKIRTCSQLQQKIHEYLTDTRRSRSFGDVSISPLIEDSRGTAERIYRFCGGERVFQK